MFFNSTNCDEVMTFEDSKNVRACSNSRCVSGRFWLLYSDSALILSNLCMRSYFDCITCTPSSSFLVSNGGVGFQ